jgi:ATP-dependent RNA helicase DDX1
MTAFEEFGVMPEIIKALEELGWELPRDIQAEAIPLILGGGDVMAAAETGSGKTGAFAIPILQITYETLKGFSEGKIDESGEIEWRLNPDDRDAAFTMDESGLLCQARLENSWAGGRTTIGVVKGKWYYEATVQDEGLCRIGWSTAAASLDLGKDRMGFGYGGTGKKANNNQFDSYGSPFGKGDTVGCFLDLDAMQIHWSLNGTEFPIAFELSPSLKNRAFYPTVTLKNAELLLNFGGTPFKYPPKGGFKGLTEADISQTTLSGAGIQTKGRKPLALILEPSRELAEQTHQALLQFGKYLQNPSIKCVLVTGGTNTAPQIQQLQEGADCVTGTLGRIDSLVDTNKLDISNVRFLVLDEADQLIKDSDNYNLVMKLYKKIPKTSKPLQVLMFSATLHDPKIKELSDIICKFPIWVDLKGKDTVPETVHHAVVFADPQVDQSWRNPDKKFITDGIHAKDRVGSDLSSPEAISEATKLLKPILLRKIIDAWKMEQALIFVRTKLEADNLEKYFAQFGGGRPGGLVEGQYSCVVLHGDRSQAERTANLERFKNGEARFLICTDVAARGIDIKELPFVINYTLPDNPADYIHRIGRVGRADAMGLAISIVAKHPEKVWYHQCPSRGKNCKDTRLVEEGGCALWWQELKYLKAIENVLGHEIVRLNENFRLPNEKEGVVYGARKDGGGDTLFKLHEQFLRPIVADLFTLEDNVQNNFWNIQTRFNTKSQPHSDKKR